ncbi:MAG: mannose-1-phosphate guanylyltransferase, partial [Thermomicrobiales bacterium]
MNLYGVILAGGGGTRLWPLSRQDRPKPLLNLLGDRSMLQETVARLAPLIAPERLYIAVNAAHAPEVARQIPEIPADQIIVEPVARETGPALGLAAIHLAHRDPDATLASFQADHVILQPGILRNAVALAARAAQDGAIATIGITPTFAATGYGYIELAGITVQEGDLCVREAVRFVEKPERETAEAYLASGNFVWNAGLFICKVRTLLDAFAAHLPETYAGLMRINSAIGTDAYVETLETVFPTIGKMSIDVGIMEKFHPLVTVPCDPGWNDVGDWDTLASLMQGDDDGNVAIGTTHLAIETKRTLVHGRDRLIATVGIEDLIIVDTP